jgi:hypothetical protein
VNRTALVTAAPRTLIDCLATGVATDLLQLALKRVAGRGFAPRAELARVMHAGRFSTRGVA